MEKKLFDALGGYETLEYVHKIFYDKIYAHPWLKQFFVKHDQQFIERQQTNFMAEKMGGPKNYMGKPPNSSHRQMYITAELFQLRKEILRESLEEFGLSEELIEGWLKIDSAFKKHIVKDSIEAFYKNTFPYEKRVIIPKAVAERDSRSS